MILTKQSMDDNFSLGIIYVHTKVFEIECLEENRNVHEVLNTFFIIFLLVLYNRNYV